MYIYDKLDQQMVVERVAQFRDQTRRYLAGELEEEEFRVLRLQNGLYLQRHAPMLRVAIPYGMLSSTQLRMLARVARRWDKGYAHLSTRQNMQFNWPRLDDVPQILAELATVQMHAIQTSGNNIRNTTTDHFAGIAPDELVNPLAWCEVIRQWSSMHPEFSCLPRKFKIAVTGALNDRAAVGVHDIGLHAIKQHDTVGFQVWVGGGLGRTPMVGKLIFPFVAWSHLLTYLEAILRVYNLHGRRDNKYKARIKILVNDLKPEEFARQVDLEWQTIKGGPQTLTAQHVSAIASRFVWPVYALTSAEGELADEANAAHGADNLNFARWLKRNVHGHRAPGYAAVTVSLKATGTAPGDITADQMEAVADMADRFGFGELRVSHEQNLILADVRRSALFPLWQQLDLLHLATPNIGLLTNIISCPGGDFCSLANAVSIPLATAIQERFDQLDYVHDIGELDLNVSGCINACGHHHIGHIGILGVDKAGEEWYQVTIGGRQNGAVGVGAGTGAAIGKIIGPSFARAAVPDVIVKLVELYLSLRDSESERFIDVVDRVGIAPFKLAVFGTPA